MARKRNDFEICQDILAEAGTGILKTRLQFRVNLNFRNLSRFLDLLVQINLIEPYHEESDGKQFYRTTQKGKEVHEKLKELSTVLRKTGEDKHVHKEVDAE